MRVSVTNITSCQSSNQSASGGMLGGVSERSTPEAMV